MSSPAVQHASDPSEVHVIDIECDIDNIINIVDDVDANKIIEKVPDSPVSPVMNGNGELISTAYTSNFVMYLSVK